MFRILVGPHRTPSRVHTREYYEQGECLQGLPGERGAVVRFASPCPPVSRMHSLTTMDDPGDEGWGFSNQRAAGGVPRNLRQGPLTRGARRDARGASDA
jgi:hypothetical protein